MSDSETSISRRRFCEGACQVASCATLATLFSACSGSSSSPSSSNPGIPLGTATSKFVGNTVQVTVSGSALATVGGAVLVQSVAGVFLVSRTSDSAFSAIEAVCTHEGCTVNGADGAIYVCPCHGSRYDRSGHVVGGPAKASLRQYASTFAGDTVTISL
jgi:cytochrome b6-f complex iron-sulfur subunit